MEAPITADTQFHDLVTEALTAAMTGVDFEPRITQINTFFKANTVEGGGCGYMVIEPADVGLTLGQIAEHVDVNDAENFVDAMFRQGFTRLDETQREAFSSFNDEQMAGMIKAVAGSMEFGYGDPDLIEGPNAAQLAKTPVRRSGPR